MRLSLPPLALLAALGLAACQKQLDAPADRGVCWRLAQLPDGKVKFNKLAGGQPDLEHCAAQLEMTRLRFRALGSTETKVTGAYQGQFLFIDPDGVFTAQSYGGYRYPFMVRTGDGRLAVPGAMPEQK
ncbi:MAG: hypothetical protein ABI306_07670 [Caulobacteraceae bacterium]